MNMVTTPRERLLTRAFVSLADTLVADYDVVDLLQNLVETSAELFGSVAGGIMLADESGDLAVVASTSEKARLVELMQLATSGPCVDAFTSGIAISVPDIDLGGAQWPEFRLAALEQGMRSAHTIPLRHRTTTIGTLNLFGGEAEALSEDDALAARGLADIATIGILHQRALRESDAAREQLQYALDSRVMIEQAKGVLAQINDYDMDQAFQSLRTYARANNLRLHDVAAQVVARQLNIPRA